MKARQSFNTFADRPLAEQNIQKSVQMSAMNNSLDSSGHFMQLEYLELAGRTLDRFITSDNLSPSFLEITGVSVQNRPTCSGLNIGDYKNLAASFNHVSLSQMKIVNKVPLPPEIMEHFAHMQCHCLMGIFPEIQRAWLTIDSDIYVWSYGQNSDVAYFDGLGETIVGVGLVQPKPGVFQNFVKYLLVLTTTVEIVVLGVTFTSITNTTCLTNNDSLIQEENFKEMQLVPEPVFVLPTDGVSMVTVQSTDKGRIFLGGKDGCLYEITYQAQLGWFGKRCNKVNHSTSTLSFLIPSFLNVALYEDDPITKIEVDNSRNILYTLSEKGSIEVFDLGNDGEGISRVMKLSQSKIVSLASDVVRTVETNNFKPVISISAVEQNESEHLNLVAVTHAGVRLYFTTGYNQNGANDQRPFCLSLLHVRMPPGYTPNAAVVKPKNVHTAAYDNGTLWMVSSTSTASEELLWCVSRGALPTRRDASLIEAISLLPLEGPAWAMKKLNTIYGPILKNKRNLWEESQWAVVSSSGVTILAGGGAPTILKTLLLECGGAESQQVKDFFQNECWSACAAACSVACESGAAAELALHALLLHGTTTQPSQASQQQQQQHQQHFDQTHIHQYPGSPRFSPRQMSTPMVLKSPTAQQQNNHSFYPQTPSFNQTPASPSPFQQTMNGSTAFNQTTVYTGPVQQSPQDMNGFQTQFSAKHNGLYIFIGKLLSPIWQLKCVTESSALDQKELLSSSLNGPECDMLHASLRGALWLVSRCSEASITLKGQPQSRSDATNAALERRSLEALAVFTRLACETLALWRVLADHQFHVLAGALPQDQRAALRAAAFRELLVGGQEVARLLQNVLIQQYLNDNASVDSISHKLRQLCPSLYREQDAACSKANELLMFARQQQNTVEREDMLQQALKLCKDVAPNVNLPLLCSKFIAADFYSGAVDLCVTCADRVDPQNNALHYYNSDQPAQDHDGYFAYHRRMEIYSIICGALERLWERGSLDCARRLATDMANSGDHVLRAALYDWAVSRAPNASLDLLPSNAPGLTRHLASRAARMEPRRALPLRDLLWQLLQKEGSEAEAARILEWLATCNETGATLEARRAWLAAGAVCARAAGGAAGDVLRRLEDAADVARVQAAVRDAVPVHARGPLSDKLIDITELYEDYAERYELWECKLAIVRCAGHRDPVLIENIWTNILNKEETLVQGRGAQDAINTILAKVASLGKEYLNSGHCFPLQFIIKQLEMISCKLGADHSSVFKVMLDIGVNVEQLLDIYTKLVSGDSRCWLSCGDELHAARVAVALLEAEHATHGPRATRAKHADLLHATRATLASRPNTAHLLATLSAHYPH